MYYPLLQYSDYTCCTVFLSFELIILVMYCTEWYRMIRYNHIIIQEAAASFMHSSMRAFVNAIKKRSKVFIIPYHVLSYLNLTYLILSYLISSYLILSYFILSYRVLPYLILPYLILSYYVSSYLILSYSVLSCHIMSYRT